MNVIQNTPSRSSLSFFFFSVLIYRLFFSKGTIDLSVYRKCARVHRRSFAIHLCSRIARTYHGHGLPRLRNEYTQRSIRPLRIVIGVCTTPVKMEVKSLLCDVAVNEETCISIGGIFAAAALHNNYCTVI